MSIKRKHQASLRLELLEDRVVPSTYWVKNTLDSGLNSLRQAILDANTHAGADEIQFKPAGEGTIKLSSELLVTGDLTISGPGSNDLVLSGKGATRVLEIATGAKVGIKDLTITSGKVTGTATGAGILNQGNLTLESSVVTGSVADATGGGIENTGTLAVKRSRIAANQSGIVGGGIHNAGTGVVTIEWSSIADNQTVRDGAGVSSEVGTTLTISDSTVTGNSASGFGTGGVASAATLTIRDTLIANNTSAVGGIYFFGFGRGGDAVIKNSIIRDNGPNATSGGGAGGIWSDSFNHITIEDTLIRHNTGSLAGGIFGSGTIDISDSIIEQNTGKNVGGINASTQLNLTRSTVSENSGNTGGIAANSATIVESTISGNTGISFGGIYSYQLNLLRSTVSGNSATPVGDGSTPVSGIGGVNITNGLIQNSTISGNVVVADQMVAYQGADGDLGDATGGVFAQAGFGGSTVSIESSTIAFNRVQNAPAGITATGGVAAGRPFSFTYNGYTYNFFGSVGVRNTIIARNETGNSHPDVVGDFQSTGQNLIGILDATATGFVGSDKRGTSAHPLDPRLKPLADNGGPTKTHALDLFSPAINAGDNLNIPTTDRDRAAAINGWPKAASISALRDRNPHETAGTIPCRTTCGSSFSTFSGTWRAILDMARQTPTQIRRQA